RWITVSYWASLVAGYLFGFSTFHVVHTISHLHMTLTFLIPVCVLLVLKRFAGDLRGARFVVALAGALVGQFLFSLELFVLLVLVGGAAGLIAWAVLRGDAAARLRETAVGAALALGLALVVVSPYIAHALFV